MDVRALELRVFAQKILDAVAGRQKVEQNVDRYARSANAGLATTHTRIRGDAFRGHESEHSMGPMDRIALLCSTGRVPPGRNPGFVQDELCQRVTAGDAT